VDVYPPFDSFFNMAIIGTVVSLGIGIAFLVIVVWAIRRFTPPRRDAAEDELRGRLARGEIDLAEFEARLRALRESKE